MPPKRMTANPVKAPRYRPGKAIAEEASSSESEASDEEAPVQNESKPIAPPPKATTALGITSNLSKVDINERRKAAAATEIARIAEKQARKAEEEEGFVTEESEGSEEEDGETGSEESSEEEESEEDVPRRTMLRPTFIKKDKRKTVKGEASSDFHLEVALAAEEIRRKAAADAILEDQIAIGLAAKAAAGKHWDDDEVDGDDVDDTDDLDPEAEYAAWKLRELKRIKREREAIEDREKVLEEVERRKNLTEDERKAEDEEYIAKQKEEKEGKGKMAYMQKYYHKGAFFQDDAKAEGLDRRDIMGSRYADDVQNRELLPQALQMRDMTKLGKKGVTKYKDLKTEDTGQWGQFYDLRPGRGGPGGFNADERFIPDRDRGGSGASGANKIPVNKGKIIATAPAGPKAMRDDPWDSKNVVTYRPEHRRADERHSRSRPRPRPISRSRSRSRSPSPRQKRVHGTRSRSRSPRRVRYLDERRRSRSRSPRRQRHDDGYTYRRKRSHSRGLDHYDSDKRRRVD